MTNLQQNGAALSPRILRRLWFGVPVAGMALLSLVMLAGLLAPLWRSLQRDTQRLRELEELMTQVSLMRQQLRAQDIQEEKALEKKDKLFRLIAGTGDVSTVLAVLDREARLAGVRLDVYEPQAAQTPPPAPGAAPPPAAGNQAAPPPPNPMEMAGLQPQGMVISVRGTYPQLLDFLRKLEALNVLVIQSDLKLEAPPASAATNRTASQQVTMKLSLTLYGRPPQAQDASPPPASAPGSPGSPAATPPAGATAPAAGAPAGR